MSIEHSSMLVSSLPLPGTLIIFLITNRKALRQRYAWLSLAAAITFFVVLTMAVVRLCGSPLHPDLTERPAGGLPLPQIAASAWWLFAAYLLIRIGRLVFQVDRNTNEAKLASDLASALIYLAAFLVIVNSVLELPVRGLLATSGVIAIVLGLALQSTLSDVFSGIAVGIEQPYVAGDRIWVEGEIEGIIVQINWRSVRIRTDSSDIAIVPNSVMARSRLVNRSVPTPRRRDSLSIRFDRQAAPDRVVDLLTQATLLSPNVLAAPAPSIALTDIGVKNSRFQIAFSVADGDLLGQTRSHLLAQVWKLARYGDLAPAAGPPPFASIDETETATTAGALAVRLLRDAPLFHALSQKQCAGLAGKLVRRVLEKEQRLFDQGDTRASLFIVASGVLAVTRETEGVSSLLGRVGPGDYIGEIGLLTGAPYAASVTALTHATAYELAKADLSQLIVEQPDLISAFEASARHGQEIIERAAAASASSHAGSSDQLMKRIRAFLHLRTELAAH